MYLNYNIMVDDCVSFFLRANSSAKYNKYRDNISVIIRKWGLGNVWKKYSINYCTNNYLLYNILY